MAAVYTSMQQHPNCCSGCAAAADSARFARNLDTALVAVSVFILIQDFLLVKS